MTFPYLLSLIIFLPLVAALLTLVLRDVSTVRWVALGTTVVTFLLSCLLYVGFDPAADPTVPQFADVTGPLISHAFDVKYFVGIDGINILLVMLTTLLGPIVVLSSWHYITKQEPAYYGLLLLLQTGVVGVFTSFDLFFFYIFFELTLIPMYFIIGIWGGENRIYAAIKFVIYTMVGSLLMLAALLYVGYLGGAEVPGATFSTDYFTLLALEIPLATQTWLFLLFALAFAIKVPLFPLHTWLPDAHVQAPTGGSVVLAGVLLKMGTYGLLRFCLPLFPNASFTWAMPLAVLGVVGIIYGALVARAQPDAKKLVAYSSVSHLGFIVIGLFAFTIEALQGALLQMINHGISTGALFLLLGMLYERRHTRLMTDYGGIAKSVPLLTFFMVFSVLASAGLPGLNGFVGEFMILIGAFKSTVIGHPGLIALATTGVILAAVYLLWMLYQVFWGPITDQANADMADLNVREFAILTPLAALMLLIGFMPQPFLDKSDVAMQHLLDTIETKQAAMAEAAAAEEQPTQAAKASFDGHGFSIESSDH